MDKILVTIHVLAIEEEYDVFLPIGLKLVDILDVLQQNIKEMSDNNYEINHSPILYNDFDGSVINIHNVIKFSGLKNGSHILLK